MLTLADLQARFTATLRARQDWTTAFDALAPHLAAPREVTEAALSLYRDNQRALWKAALDNAFPVVGQLVGDEFFGGLAHAYAALHPSSNGDLNQYGMHFASFLNRFEPARTIAYLSDVAALEWAVHRAHFSAKPPATAPTRFAGATTLALTLFAWHPALVLLETATPAAQIWLAHQAPEPSLAQIDLDAPGPHFASVAPAHVDVIQAADAAFLRALKQGQTFGEALYAALAVDPAYALEPQFSTWLAKGILIAKNK